MNPAIRSAWGHSSLRLATCVIGGLLAHPVAAQPQDVVTLLQELSRKVDRLQADVDALKGNRRPASAARMAQPGSTDPGTASPTGSAFLKPGEKLAEGWVVSVHSVGEREQAGENIGRFIARNDGFSFGEARQGVYYPAHAVFRGDALFRAKEPGHYVMLNRISWSEPSASNLNNRTRCNTTGRFMDQTIILKEKSSFTHVTNQPITRQFDGGFDVRDAGAYPVSFEVVCFLLGYDNDATASYMGQIPKYRDWYDGIRFSVLFNGPGDLKARTPSEAELFHKMLAGERR